MRIVALSYAYCLQMNFVHQSSAVPFEALALFVDRERNAAQVLANYASAHQSESPEAFSALAAEHTNLENATIWSETQPELAPILIDLALSQMHYWRVQGYWTLAQEAIRGAITASQRSRDERAQAILKGNLAIILSCLGKFQEAEASCREARDELNDPRAEAGILFELGNIALQRGEYGRAENTYRQALTLRQQLNDENAIGHSLYGLATVASNRGDYSSAIESFARSLSLVEKTRDIAGITANHHALGNLFTRQGNYTLAGEQYQKALDHSRTLGDRPSMATALYGLGSIALETGSWQKAESLLYEALTVRIEIGDMAGIVDPIIRTRN